MSDIGDVVTTDAAEVLFLVGKIISSGKYLKYQKAVFCVFISNILPPKRWF